MKLLNRKFDEKRPKSKLKGVKELEKAALVATSKSQIEWIEEEQEKGKEKGRIVMMVREYLLSFIELELDEKRERSAHWLIIIR